MADLHDWRRLVQASLKGRDFESLQSRTRDGIRVEPLYRQRTDRLPFSGRGAESWEIVQVIDHPDPDEANAQAREDIGGGATGLALRFAANGSASGLPATEEALRIACEGVDLAAIRLRLEPHPHGPQIARWLQALVA